ncbi:hypothetical protein BDZ45DRAFT_391430 [Acephala macrosclerotiorum]|nr:hypothetical protein BDZ45DRAFT_391430 [Acephala macrosclerotiorum]
MYSDLSGIELLKRSGRLLLLLNQLLALAERRAWTPLEVRRGASKTHHQAGNFVSYKSSCLKAFYLEVLGCCARLGFKDILPNIIVSAQPGLERSLKVPA